MITDITTTIPYKHINTLKFKSKRFRCYSINSANIEIVIFHQYSMDNIYSGISKRNIKYTDLKSGESCYCDIKQNIIKYIII